jgi:hypothetical protein
MLRHLICVLTMLSLLGTTVFSEVASAATKADKEAAQAEKIKQKVAKMGTGESARVKVSLKNQINELKGYVSDIREDSFVVTDSKTKAATTVAYRDVVHLSGKGLSKTVKIVIVAGVVLFLSLYISLVAYPAAASH